MFYFTDKVTGEVVSLPTDQIHQIYEDSTIPGDVVIQEEAAGRVHRTTDNINTIHSTNFPQDLVIVTSALDGRTFLFPNRVIKRINATPSGSLVFFANARTSVFASSDSPATIVRNSQNSSTLPIVANEGIILVTATGDDAAAMAAGNYDITRPFKNPTVAMAQAQVGDIVQVYGVHTIGATANGDDIDDDGNQQMVRNGVILDMQPGSSIAYNNLTGTFSLPFTDGGSAGTFIIRGSGRFVFNRNISNGDSFLVTRHADSIVDWEFDEIDIRRRFGGNSHNAASWRMKGRRWLNRESMLFAFRYPNLSSTANRLINIDVEQVEVRSEFAANIRWTRQEIRFLRNSSIANITYGEVVFPSSYAGGGFHQDVFIDDSSVVNFKVKHRIRRTATDNVHDHLLRHMSNNGGGDYELNGILTRSGLQLLNLGTTTSNLKKRTKLSGVVLDGSTIGTPTPATLSLLGNFDCMVDNTVIFDILVLATNTNIKGLNFNRSPLTIFSGRVDWKHTEAAVRLNAASLGRLMDLRITGMQSNVASIENLNAAAANLVIINSYATNAVSTANGGINQLVENLVVDSSI